jgi:hypothetical protein
MKPIWCVLLVPLLVSPARAETPAEALLQAFKNAETATHTRSDLTTTVDGATSRQLVTRVRPDRTHLVTVPANGPAQEVILIGRTLYTRQGNAWSESPGPAQPGLSLDPTAGLKAVCSQLTERPRQTLDGRQQRVFAGAASWQAGRNVNKGTLEILVDAGRTLPTRLSFVGQCGSRACSFTQIMDFSASLTVTAPTVAPAGTGGAPSDMLLALRSAGIDFSVPEAELRQWLDDRSTPYPAIAGALLKLLEGQRLRRPVYLDVIVWNYEHAPGGSSRRRVGDIDLARLRAAVVEGYNTRYGEGTTDFQKLVR